MTRRIVYLDPADDDIEEIVASVRKHSRGAAERLRDAILIRVGELAETPGLGHARPGVARPELRFLSVKGYVVAYVYDDETLTVERVVHGSRDIDKLF